MDCVPRVHFKGEFDDFDTEMKGYRNDVFVETPDGKIYEVFFYDPVRLTNDLGDGVYLAQPGLIVLNTVNETSIEKAVIDLWQRGYFDYLKPTSIGQKHFGEDI
jgi:hypothetical protein